MSECVGPKLSSIRVREMMITFARYDDDHYEAIKYEGMSRAKEERCILVRCDAQSSALLRPIPRP